LALLPAWVLPPVHEDRANARIINKVAAAKNLFMFDLLEIYLVKISA
jgi:hypothetical protein